MSLDWSLRCFGGGGGGAVLHQFYSNTASAVRWKALRLPYPILTPNVSICLNVSVSLQLYLVVREKGVLAHMTIPIIKSSRTHNFPVIKNSTTFQNVYLSPFHNFYPNHRRNTSYFSKLSIVFSISKITKTIITFLTELN